MIMIFIAFHGLSTHMEKMLFPNELEGQIYSEQKTKGLREVDSSGL